jgi:nitrous oxidase accessory protein NosD
VIEGNATSGAQGANIALRHGRIAGTLIQDNQATEGDSSQEGWGASITVSERGSTAADIGGTVVRGNRLDFTFGGGIFVGPAAPGTLVERNRLDDMFGLPAIENEADRTLIRRNTTTSESFPGSTNPGSRSTRPPRTPGWRPTRSTVPAASASRTAAPAPCSPPT